MWIIFNGYCVSLFHGQLKGEIICTNYNWKQIIGCEIIVYLHTYVVSATIENTIIAFWND